MHSKVLDIIEYKRNLIKQGKGEIISYCDHYSWIFFYIFEVHYVFCIGLFDWILLLDISCIILTLRSSFFKLLGDWEGDNGICVILFDHTCIENTYIYHYQFAWWSDMEKLTSDLLGIMMMAKDEETGVGLTDLELKNEVMTLMGAGHEVDIDQTVLLQAHNFYWVIFPQTINCFSSWVFGYIFAKSLIRSVTITCVGSFSDNRLMVVKSLLNHLFPM